MELFFWVALWLPSSNSRSCKLIVVSICIYTVYTYIILYRYIYIYTYLYNLICISILSCSCTATVWPARSIEAGKSIWGVFYLHETVLNENGMHHRSMIHQTFKCFIEPLPASSLGRVSPSMEVKHACPEFPAQSHAGSCWDFATKDSGRRSMRNSSGFKWK